MGVSYGRSPYYIYSDGHTVHFHFNKGESAHVPEEVLAQFIARMCARGTDEVMAWVDQGVALSPGDFSDDFAVSVTGGWR